MDAPIKQVAEGSQRTYAVGVATTDVATKKAVADMLATARVAITTELLAKDKARATEVLLSLRMQFSSYSTSTSSIIVK